MTTVDSWPKTLPMTCAWSWNSTTETHLLWNVFWGPFKIKKRLGDYYKKMCGAICPSFWSSKKQKSKLVSTVGTNFKIWHRLKWNDPHTSIDKVDTIDLSKIPTVNTVCLWSGGIPQKVFPTFNKISRVFPVCQLIFLMVFCQLFDS